MYNPIFERNPKGGFDIDNNFVSIQSGSEAYLLEDELNELQWIQYEQRAQSIRSIMNSGIISNTPIITDSNTVFDNALYIKSHNNYEVGINSILMGIKNYIPININGYVFKLSGTYDKDISGEATSYNNILIELYNEDITETKDELVYLEIWFENINSVNNQSIRKYGGSTNEYSSFENDIRFNKQMETTRRIQLKWAIRSKIDCTTLTSINPDNNSDYKYIKAKDSNGKSYSNDANLYVCDVKLKKQGKAIDNMYYAIPLFLIKRKNRTQITLDDVTPLYSLCQNYISNFTNDSITFGTNGNIVLKNNDGTIEFKNPLNSEYYDLKTKKIESESISTGSITTNNTITGDIKINDTNTNKKITLKNNDQTLELKNDVANKFADLSINNLNAESNISTQGISLNNISITDSTNNKTTKITNSNGNLQILDSGNTETKGFGDLTVGNLYIKGTSTIVESETVAIADNILMLNSNLLTTATPTENAGIEINRGKSTNAVLFWDENKDIWTAGLSGSQDAILLKNSPTMTTPIIENNFTFKTLLSDKTLTINATDDSSVLSSITFDGSTSGKKLWSITTGDSKNNIATINSNNIICNNIGESARISIANGTAKPADDLAKGTNEIFIDHQNKKIYFDKAANNWVDVGRPSNITECDTNFTYNTTTPTENTRLNYNGNFYATRVYNAVYNDYAEYFERGDNTIEPGDVVACSYDDDNVYIKSSEPYSKLVVGVCSDSYGHILGGEGKESDEDNFIPLGLSGRVNVKVIGNVKKGDLLVTSHIPGVAMKSEQYIPGTVIGKALESHNGNKINRIKMLIMNI